MVWRKEESMDNQNEKKPTLEEAFTRIEAILTQMEQPEISLEESFSLYQQGVLQLKNCGTILDEVEKKMQILGEDAEIEEMSERSGDADDGFSDRDGGAHSAD